MVDQAVVTATRADGGVALTVYDMGDVVRVLLSPKRALSIGLDLCGLAAEGVFRLVAEKDPARSGSGPVKPGRRSNAGMGRKEGPSR